MSEREPSRESRKNLMSGRQTYNLVTDIVTGPNVRLRDNLYQGLAILVCLLLGAGAGLLMTTERMTGALIGGLAGLVLGLFGSGLFLMIYRAFKHTQGDHD